MHKLPFVMPVLAAGLLAHCATTSKRELTQFNQRLDDLAQRTTISQDRVEDLHQRIGLIEERLHEARLGDGRHQSAVKEVTEPAHLPVVRLSPSGQQEVQEASTEEVRVTKPVTVGGESVVSEDNVSYTGDAQDSGPRPVLRLHGTSSSDDASAISRQEPIVTKERLAVVPLPAPRNSSNPLANAAAAEKAYQAALALHRQANYGAAIAAFQKFLQHYPRHQHADNAVYWIGESYYDQQRYHDALTTFQRVVRDYANGNKAPDALLKIGLCHIRLNDRVRAKAILSKVQKSYPETAVARLATNTLAQIP